MKTSDGHRWTNFVIPCTLNQSADHLCHQGSNFNHYHKLPQLPSCIHTGPRFLSRPYMFYCDNSFRVRVLNSISQCSTTFFPVLSISVPLMHAHACKYRPTLVSKTTYIPYTNVQTKHETIHSAIISHVMQSW